MFSDDGEVVVMVVMASALDAQGESWWWRWCGGGDGGGDVMVMMVMEATWWWWWWQVRWTHNSLLFRYLCRSSFLRDVRSILQQITHTFENLLSRISAVRLCVQVHVYCSRNHTISHFAIFSLDCASRSRKWNHDAIPPAKNYGNESGTSRWRRMMTWTIVWCHLKIIAMIKFKCIGQHKTFLMLTKVQCTRNGRVILPRGTRDRVLTCRQEPGDHQNGRVILIWI